MALFVTFRCRSGRGRDMAVRPSGGRRSTGISLIMSRPAEIVLRSLLKDAKMTPLELGARAGCRRL